MPEHGDSPLEVQELYPREIQGLQVEVSSPQGEGVVQPGGGQADAALVPESHLSMEEGVRLERRTREIFTC